MEVSFYGYVRGGSYRVNGRVHVVGLGDLMVKDIRVVEDPCPEYRKEDTEEKCKKDMTKGDMEAEGS